VANQLAFGLVAGLFAARLLSPVPFIVNTGSRQPQQSSPCAQAATQAAQAKADNSNAGTKGCATCGKSNEQKTAAVTLLPKPDPAVTAMTPTPLSGNSGVKDSGERDGTGDSESVTR
jgi:hypothetical protein